jgi:DNA gyrase subunit A
MLEGLAIALANIDPIIELIRKSPTPAEAKIALTARSWELGNVKAMLEKAGEANVARPDWLADDLGIRDGQYFISEQQAQGFLTYDYTS